MYTWFLLHTYFAVWKATCTAQIGFFVIFLGLQESSRNCVAFTLSNIYIQDFHYEINLGNELTNPIPLALSWLDISFANIEKHFQKCNDIEHQKE